jgi:hypothetical protein
MTETLAELATLVRSKNAGPFWVTIDVFLPDIASYNRVTRSSLVDATAISKLYDVEPDLIRIFQLPDLRAIKISFPRPATQGSRHDRDMHAGQQFVPLLSLQVS